MSRFYALLLLVLPALTPAFAQNHTYPQQTKWVTTDLTNFWQMVDSLKSARSYDDSLLTLRIQYLNKASVGLREYLEFERANGDPNLEKAYLQMLADYPAYFASIRGETVRLAAFRPFAVEVMTKLANIQPGFVCLDSYVFFGLFSTPTRVMRNGMGVSAEWFAPKNADTSEMDDVLVEDLLAVNAQTIGGTLAHEAVRLNQSPAQRSDKPTVLNWMLQQGAADFIAQYVTYGESSIQKGEYYDAEKLTWLSRNEATVKTALRQEQNNLMYNAGTEKWNADDDQGAYPAGIGYAIGYRMVRDFYQRSSNKQKALRSIIRLDNPGEIVQGSRFFRD